MIETEILAALGIFSACLARTVIPFLRKKAEAVEKGQIVKWENRFLWTLIFAIFVSIVSTMLILPAFEIPSSFVFPMAFAYGWAAQDITNKVVK